MSRVCCNLNAVSETYEAMIEKERVIVIGGGFAGVQLIRHLDARRYEVVLIDQLNHHQFQPLFYQVATSQLEPSSISFPFRYMFKNRKHIKVRYGKVTHIDRQQRTITTDEGATYAYDKLVVAIGCKTNFFGNDELGDNAFTLKSTYDAITIRNHIIKLFEYLVSVPEEEREPYLNLVIVGGGPTGVELAGAFAEIKRDILPKDYHDVDFSRFRVILVEGAEAPLSAMSREAQNAAIKFLTKLGVELKLKVFVKNYDGQTVIFSDGESLLCRTVIWAAGVTGNSVTGLPEAAKAPGNRLRVDRFNRVEQTEHIFALGDIAYMETPKYERGHPQVANVAIGQAKNLADNLNREVKQKAWSEYEYKDLGAMATIGRNKAVVDLPFWRFSGRFAWAFWMFLHLMLILSVKKKLIIFINWAWAYVTKDTSLRLILKQSRSTKEIKMDYPRPSEPTKQSIQ